MSETADPSVEPAPEPIDPARDPEFGGSPRHDAYAAIRVPDYRRLIIAALASSVGNEIQQVAIGWELYERTKSATVLGLIGLSQVIPIYLMALPAGHAADRYDRRRIFAFAQALLIVSSLGLAAISFGGGPIWATYACLVLSGCGLAILRPSRWAMLPQVVPKEALQNAVTWQSTSWQFAAVLGPPVGGLLLAKTGLAGWAYLATAGLSLASMGLILRIRSRPAPVAAGKTSLKAFLAGFSFIWSNQMILGTITLDLFAVLLGGAQALLPMFASEILHVGPEGLGWLRSAESIGAVAMAVTLAHRAPFRRAGPTLLAAVATFGLAMIGFGLSTDIRLSFAFLVLAGAVDNISVVVRSTLVQLLTPDSMRGRVSAVNGLFIGTSNELGGFESGMTAEWFGPILSVVGGGIGTLVVVGVVALAWPGLARLGSIQKPP